MIKKTVLFVTVLMGFLACKPSNNEATTTQMQPKDSTIVGVDKDENGCLASAGYTWSKLNKECVKVFTGIQLMPISKTVNVDDATAAAYVLFNEDGTKAEVFLPEEKSIILSRDSKKEPWIFEDYQLQVNKGYVLKKGAVDLFSGDGEVGNKVTGSDDGGSDSTE